MAPIAVVGQVDRRRGRDRGWCRPTDGHRPGVAARLHGARHAIPDDARPQLGELVRGVVAGEHAEDRLERVAAQLGEVLGAAHQGEQLVDRPGALGGGGHDLLGQHVERVARDDGRLDGALVHAARDDGALEQVAAVLGEDDAARWLADLVAGPPDALEPAGDRHRRLDLDDEVDGAHVDAQLERAGGHEPGSRPSLSASSISSRCSRASEPWWARTSSSPASSLSWSARRSARRRLLVKTIVLRCARMSSRMRG